MLQNDQRVLNKSFVSITAFGLWVLTSALAFWEILVIREIILRLYLHFVPVDLSQRAATSGIAVLSTWIFVPLAILFIAVAIGGAEFHYRRVGQARSWQVFGWTLAAEISILVLALFI